jgi:hypothetical protein
MIKLLISPCWEHISYVGYNFGPHPLGFDGIRSYPPRENILVEPFILMGLLLLRVSVSLRRVGP